MSDTPQGEGWWYASDGKWYPPESAPGWVESPAEQAPAAVEPPVPPTSFVAPNWLLAVLAAGLAGAIALFVIVVTRDSSSTTAAIDDAASEPSAVPESSAAQPTVAPEPTAPPEPTTPPEPTPTPAGPVVVTVAADGSGDFASIEAAAAELAAGSTIELGPGRHQLAATLELAADVSLIGADAATTTLVGPGDGPVVSIIGGAVSMQSVAFAHEGTTAADVVVVGGGQAIFDGCVFTGGVYDQGADSGGSGLVVEADGSAVVTNSTSESNQRYAFFARGTSVVDITDSTATGSGNDGVVIAGSATATITASSSDGNTDRGFLFLEDAAAVVTDSSATGNELTGFQIANRADVSVTASTAEGNSTGFVVEDSATAVLADNTSSANGIGFRVDGQSAPQLSGNFATDNDIGFAWFGEGAGTAEANTSSQNEFGGFFVQGSAAPTLTANMATAEQSGFTWGEMAGGIAEGNVASETEVVGFSVFQSAAPCLVSNVANDSVALGMSIDTDGPAEVTGTTGTGNDFGLIVGERSTLVTLSGNTIEGTQGDVVDLRP